MTTTPDEVLKFWFEESRRAQWFGKEPAFDAEIDRRFGALTHQARDGKLERWVETPRSCLALIILIDQFSRNLYRGSPLAWSADVHALAIAKLALEKGFDQELTRTERTFMYMPLMHSEDLADQERSFALTRKNSKGGDDFHRKNHESAVRHRDIIARFGRFPHRNEVLGRDSTTEELAFLEEPNSSF